MATQVSGGNPDPSTWLTLNGHPLIFQEGTDNLEAGAQEYKNNELCITRYAPRPVEIFIDQEQIHTHDYGYWQWRPRSYAGLYELRIQVPGSSYPDQVTHVRVVPQYFTQALYQKMQDDISRIAVDLLFSLDATVSERVQSVSDLQDASPLQEYRQIRTIINKLKAPFSLMRHNPYRVLSTTLEQREWIDVQQFHGDSHALGGDVIPVSRRMNGQVCTLALPATWQVAQSIPSYNVYENRLLKQFLRKQLTTKLTMIQERAEEEIRQRKVTLAYKQKNRFKDAEDEQKAITSLERAILDCQQLKRRCLQWASEAFLQTVRGDVSGDKATQVLLKRPGYSQFYKLYLEFQQKLQISLDTTTYVTDIGLRKISELYEMWSVFEITRLVIDELQSHGYGQSEQHLFYEVEKNSFHFQVRKNIASIILTKDDRQVKIIYEPVYPNAALTQAEKLVTTHGRSLPQTPDMVIELYQNNKPQAVCIFDAKYKRERDERDGGFYPLVTDIDKMANYARNIQYQRYHAERRSFRTQHIVSSAYVLYPGNRVYEEANGEIGGIPLRPNMSPRLQVAVRQKVREILADADIL